MQLSVLHRYPAPARDPAAIGTSHQKNNYVSLPLRRERLLRGCQHSTINDGSWATAALCPVSTLSCLWSMSATRH